ncbi:unnamed protein product, partial [Effrenium voratum]
MLHAQALAERRPGGPGPDRPKRILQTVLAAAATVCLAWANISERWHCFQVEVPPSEVFEMYKAMTSIMPANSHPVTFSASAARKLERAKEPRVAFELQAGFWSASVSSLCKPSDDIFAVFVDEKKCKAKLAHFCEDILDEDPKDAMVRHSYEKCLRAVQHGAVSLSLLLEPPALNDPDGDFDVSSYDGLQSGFEVHEEDTDPDICDTLANCELLVEMRPWNFLLIFLASLSMVFMGVATYFFGRSIVSQDPKLPQNGCHVMLLSALALVAVLGLNIYVGEKFAVEDLFRTEDLYYFMMPDGSDHAKPTSMLQLTQEPRIEPRILPKRLQKRLNLLELESSSSGDAWKEEWPEAFPLVPMSAMEMDVGLGELQGLNSSLVFEALEALRAAARHKPLLQIPQAKWQGALITLSGNLMSALASGKMSTFLDPLKEAAKRAWSKSDKILNAWFGYMQKSMLDAPNHGGAFLNSLVDDFISMNTADEVCQQFGGTCASQGPSRGAVAT